MCQGGVRYDAVFLALDRGMVGGVSDAAWQAFQEARELAYAASLVQRATADPLNAAPYVRRSLLLLLRALATCAGVTSEDLSDIVAAAESVEERERLLGFPIKQELDRLDALERRFSSLKHVTTEEEARQLDRLVQSLPRVLASVRRYLVEHGMAPRTRLLRRRFVRTLAVTAALCAAIAVAAGIRKVGRSVYEGVAYEGLQGVYFRDPNFSEVATARRDVRVDFAWGAAAPIDGMPPDRFSVRWFGRLRIPADDTYTFHVASDDGSRLYIDDRLVVDNWGNHSIVESMGVQPLKAGVVSLRLEYFDNVGDAAVHLSWSTGARPKQIIAGEYFVR